MSEQRTISVLVQVQVPDGGEREAVARALESAAAEVRGGARVARGWAMVDPGGGPPDPGVVGKAAT